jgi:hypothetical protein
MKPRGHLVAGSVLVAAAAVTATDLSVPSGSVSIAATQSEATILAAGDIARCSGSGEATATVLSNNPAGTIASPGDHEYRTGALTQFEIWLDYDLQAVGTAKSPEVDTAYDSQE